MAKQSPSADVEVVVETTEDELLEQEVVEDEEGLHLEGEQDGDGYVLKVYPYKFCGTSKLV